jgi:hypothetical protein
MLVFLINFIKNKRLYILRRSYNSFFKIDLLL